MFKKIFPWIQRHERHLSAFAMVAGFVVDNIFFERVDLWQTQMVFAAYAAMCFVAIPLSQWIETRKIETPVWKVILPFVTQFALGGFWSGFVIFYGRSADFGVSWPFLLFLVLILIGSEYFHQYHSRLVFTSVLFFFALYSYAIFAVPIYTGTISTLTFLASGLAAIVFFGLFTVMLRWLIRDRFLTDVWRIRVGALLVLIIVNISYFTNILPPLPLSSEAGGVYHSVWHVPGAYLAKGETQPWKVRYLGFSPTVHVTPGEFLYAYSSVFAPTALTTTIVHRWEWYDVLKKQWVTRAVIAYPIVGGRDGGYRGYSATDASMPGDWRVDIETADGRLIDRISFTADQVATPPAVEAITLK